MKTKYIFGLLLLCIGTLVSLNSCQYNACKARAVECMHQGVCNDGKCICINGWEGDSCQTGINEKFDSYYAMVRTEIINNSVKKDGDDTLRVIADASVRNKVSIYSIRQPDVIWVGQVSGNLLLVEEQTIGIQTYHGSGSLNDQVLTLTMYDENPLFGLSSKITYVGYKYE